MATRSAVEGERAAIPLTSEWVVFTCGGHQFAVAVDRVRKIVRGRPATRLPGCDDAVVGLINIRGRIVSVVDFGAMMGLRPAVRADAHWLLLMDYHGRRIGVAVEDVSGMAGAGDTPLHSPAAGAGDGELLGGDELEALDVRRDDVIGIGALDDRPFVAVDADAVLGRWLV